MSLLGYTEEDVEAMQESLEYAMQDAHDRGDATQYQELYKTFDFLEGLLAEGRI